jgi:cholesterol oxidase
LKFEREVLARREERGYHYVRTPVTSDQAEIRLTRFDGADKSKGPVLLAPGFAMSSYAFRLPTIHRNLTEYLAKEGWDVWLLDYRVSELSRSSGTQFTVDAIARYDFPAAVQRIQTTTGKRVQILGHCVGSVAPLMSLLAGHLSTDQVQSLICSQFFTHINPGRLNQLKAYLRLGELLQLVKVRPSMGSRVTTESSLPTRIMDRLLMFYPSQEQCRNPVCRRNLFLYGEVTRHDQLNDATHEAMYDMFANGNLTSLRHLSRMLRAQQVRPASGRQNPYLTEGAARRLLHLPVTLIQGSANGVFLPTGADRTLAWLNRSNPDAATGLYQLRPVPNYGHLDLFIGRNAWYEVFPIFKEELERGLLYQRPAATTATASRAIGAGLVA